MPEKKITQIINFGGSPVEVAFTSDLISAGAPANRRAMFDGPCPVSISVGGHKITHMLAEELCDRLAEIAESRYLSDADDAQVDARIESEYIDITGTTTITSFGTVSAGIRKKVKFSGVLTLTHNATSLILPNAE